MVSASSPSASNTDRAHRIDHHFKERDVKGPEHQWQPEQQRDQGEAGDRHMDGENVGHRLAQIVVDPPPEAHGSNDRCKIVIEQDQRGGFAGDVGPAAPHGDADVSRLQGRSVVHAVAGHRNDLAVGLERSDDP
jgi:hypothetical protein